MNGRVATKLSAVAAAALQFVAGAHATASAQRSGVPAEPPPATIELAPAGEGEVPSPTSFHRVLRVHARVPLELAADRRLLRLEVRPAVDPARRRARAPRPIVCEHPDRPLRIEQARRRWLAAGERWQEWIDVREYCFGPALEALVAPGADIVAIYGVRTAGPGAFAVRSGPGLTYRELGPIPVPLVALPRAGEPPGVPVRVQLRDADAVTGRSLVFQIAVLGSSETRRAYVRRDRFRFRVRGPEGEYACGLPPGGGRPTPDLFQRLGPRAGPRFALEATWVCRDRFRRAGVYEVVPELALEHEGAEWALGAITGTFTGPPALIRIRRDERGYVPRAVGEEGAS